MKKLLGIATVLATLILFVLGFILNSQGVMFSSGTLKLTFVMLALVVALNGIYLTKQYCKPSALAKYSIIGLGSVVVVLTFLTAYEMLDPKSTWNIVIGLGVIFITLVQLQLIRWEKSRSLLKVLGLLTILGNSFIAIYFIALLSMESLGIVLDIAVPTSVFAFLIGLILSRERRKKSKAAEA